MKTISILLLPFFVVTLSSFAQIRYLKGRLQAGQEGGNVSSFGAGTVIVKYTSMRLLKDRVRQWYSFEKQLSKESSFFLF